jgi:hypothetical protein
LGIAEVPFLKEFFLKGLPLNVVDPWKEAGLVIKERRECKKV